MYKLIIVDDEHSIRSGLCNYFPWKEIGFEVVADFENGRLALEYLRENKTHVVLTDVRMPVMDGIELARLVSESGIRVKMVFVSGYKDFEYAKKAMDYGVRSYILKPTKYDGLFEVFTKLRLGLDKESCGDAGAPSREQEGRVEKPSAIDGIKAYIAEHIKDVTLENAASYSRLNPYYLSSLFHQQTGEKFYDYVLRVKMDTAARLLCETDAKIYEISVAVGYTNANSFSRTFKNYFNVSPKDFRRPGGMDAGRGAPL